MSNAANPALDEPRIPQPALLLGLGGLIPFAACALGIWALDASLSSQARFALSAYGAVILSFLGGIRWGTTLQVPGDLSWETLGWSVVPSLVAWPALLLPAAPQLLLLTTGFAVQFWRDYQAVANRQLPVWFGRLRIYLTGGAMACLIIGLAGVLAG